MIIQGSLRTVGFAAVAAQQLVICRVGLDVSLEQGADGAASAALLSLVLHRVPHLGPLVGVQLPGIPGRCSTTATGRLNGCRFGLDFYPV